MHNSLYTVKHTIRRQHKNVAHYLANPSYNSVIQFQDRKSLELQNCPKTKIMLSTMWKYTRSGEICIVLLTAFISFNLCVIWHLCEPRPTYLHTLHLTISLIFLKKAKNPPLLFCSFLPAVFPSTHQILKQTNKRTASFKNWAISVITLIM